MTPDENRIAEALAARADSAGNRRWNCLTEAQIAAYADRRVPEGQKKGIEEHLAGCEYCLGQLAFLARAAHAVLSEEVPAYLLTLGMQVTEPEAGRQRGIGWRWRAAISFAAVAACVVIVSVVTLREPATQTPVTRPPISVQAPPATEHPIPPPPEKAPSVRGTARPATLPSLLFPRRGMVISRDRLEFRWDSVPGALYYDVTLANADGDLIWSGTDERNRIKIPSEVGLSEDVHYFVWVRAHFSKGKTVKSETVAFTVSGKP